MSKVLPDVSQRIRQLGSSHARGAPRPVLFLSATSGLGNRLRAWMGYRALSLCCGVPFYLCWQPTWACDAKFSELFEPPPFPVIDLATCYDLLRKGEVDCYLSASWCDDIWRNFAADAVGWPAFMAAVRQSLAEIRFKAELVDRAARFARRHGLARRIGIHIRHTDNLREYRKWHRRWPERFAPALISNPQGFFRAMDRLARGTRFFVATDSDAIAREIKRRYAGRACMVRKTFRPLRTGDRRKRTTSVEAAVREFLLLGRCRKIIGTYYSSFARISAILGGRDYWEIQGERCIQDPPIPTGPRLLNCRAFHRWA